MTDESYDSEDQTQSTKINDGVDIEIQALPLKPGSKLGENIIEKLISQSESGFTYIANNGKTILQEYFPLQFAVRDDDGVSLLLADAQYNDDYENGLDEFILLSEILSKIDHPGRVVDYNEKSGAAWYIVDLSVKVTLEDLLKTGQRLHENTILKIIHSVTSYLEAAHSSGRSHLELTPNRILMADEERLVVTGFNVDKYHYPPKDKFSNYDYRALELINCNGDLGPWSDYYSLGAILYQSTCKTTPVEANTRLAFLNANEESPYIPATEAAHNYFSKPLLQLIDSLLNLKPDERPDSSEIIIDTLSNRQLSPQKNTFGAEDKSPEEHSFNPKELRNDYPRNSALEKKSNAPSLISKITGDVKDLLTNISSATSAGAFKQKAGNRKLSASEHKPSQPKNTENKTIKSPHSSKNIKIQSSLRQEPIFSNSNQNLEDTLKELEETNQIDSAPNISNDLRKAGNILDKGKYFNRPIRILKKRAGFYSDKIKAIFYIIKSTTAQSFIGISGSLKGIQIGKVLLKHYQKRRALFGVILAFSTLVLIYVIATPPTPNEDNGSETTIEIVDEKKLTTSVISSPIIKKKF